ncbi:hypothetical protein, partial [Cupriavidus lacunae]|uniref:hypothetical protein n=1 Tax=Cupriavidus lacunae TaxID=2666307 RepID=UPI001AC00B31
ALNSAVCTLRFLPSLIRHHPVKDDSLNHRLITVSNRGSTLALELLPPSTDLTAIRGLTAIREKSATSPTTH